MQTRKELLATAKNLGIKGRYDMKTADLAIRVQQHSASKVIRKGRNLSGNKPFVPKIYQCGRIVHEDQLVNEPKQVQQLVRFIATSGIKAQGGDIVKKAVKAGVLKTNVKDPRELFGYYAKRLANYGVSSKYAA